MATRPPRSLPPTTPAAVGEPRRIADVLREETIGGALLVAAAALAMIWANSPWSAGYQTVRGYTLGPAALHLDLTLAAWAADGLLAVFFFVAGLELKRVLVAGELRDPRRAVVPLAAALGGVIVPALLYLLLTRHAGAGASRGWAVPTATDIAFALAVLAVVGRGLPLALRTFLLTLAVVDDLVAIVIIAVFYTTRLDLIWLLVALLPVAGFTLLVRRGVHGPWALLPLAVVTWGLVHASGVHATVAGVALALAVPVRSVPGPGTGDPGGSDESPVAPKGLAEQFEHRIRPVSAGIAVPLFALLATGVDLRSAGGLGAVPNDPVAVAVIVGLLLGKPAGVLAATWWVIRFTRARLDADLGRWELAALALLSGIGFTVSLLIADLGFGLGTARGDQVTVAVLLGSLGATLGAGTVLQCRRYLLRRHPRFREGGPAAVEPGAVPPVAGTVTGMLRD